VGIAAAQCFFGFPRPPQCFGFPLPFSGGFDTR